MTINLSDEEVKNILALFFNVEIEDVIFKDNENKYIGFSIENTEKFIMDKLNK